METAFVRNLDSIPSVNASWLAPSLWSRMFIQYAQPKQLTYKGKTIIWIRELVSHVDYSHIKQNQLWSPCLLFSSTLLIISGNYTNPYLNSKKINEPRVEVCFIYRGEHIKAFLEIIKQRVWSVLSIYIQKGQKKFIFIHFYLTLFLHLTDGEYINVNLHFNICGKYIISPPWSRKNSLFSRNHLVFFIVSPFLVNNNVCHFYYVSVIILFAICTLSSFHTTEYALFFPFNRQENWISERLFIHLLICPMHIKH